MSGPTGETDTGEERATTIELTDESGALDAFRGIFALERDVLVLSVAMFAFSLGFQMTSRFLPEYLVALGASGLVVGLFGTVGNVLSAVFPYPGGALSDRIGSRRALTLFGLLSTLGFAIWLVAPRIGPIVIADVTIEPWIWIFGGLVLAQAWKSLGLGATFAVVKQATDPSKLAAGFASTETFRRTAFLIGPVLAAILIGSQQAFVESFQSVLAVGVAVGVLGTLAQRYLYEAGEDTLGATFAGVDEIRRDLRAMPDALRPLLVGDTLVRFANGMVYVFFILVVTQFLAVGVETSIPVPPGPWRGVTGGAVPIDLSPAAFFGYLLGIEMAVALLVMAPAAKLAERVGLKPVVAVGFLVYAVFPVLLISAPAEPLVLIVLFGFSGLRFAGLPSHKALIVGPAQQGAGGRVTGTYYLLRNVIVIPSAAVGGVLWDGLELPGLGIEVSGEPTLAFTVASAIGLVGTAYFLVFGREFEAYV